MVRLPKRPGGGGATRRTCMFEDPPFDSEARPPRDFRAAMLTKAGVVSIRTAPPLVRPRLFCFTALTGLQPGRPTMKVRSSLKSLKGRHRDCKIVRRKGVVYVINKTDPRFKAKQG